MAATWRIKASNQVFGGTKSMLVLWNGVGSAQIPKVQRVWCLNNQVGSAVGTGVIIELRLTLITAHTTPVLKIIPVKMKGTSSALDANIAASSGSTVTATSIFKRHLWSGDEPTQAELNTDTMQLFPNWNILWDTSVAAQGIIEPITLNAGQGLQVLCQTTTTATYMGDVIMEFTI